MAGRGGGGRDRDREGELCDRMKGMKEGKGRVKREKRKGWIVVVRDDD